MQVEEHDRALITVGDVEARLLADPDDLADALRVLDTAEAAAGAPLVDQAERHRLEQAVAGAADTTEHHHAVLAHRRGACVGYAGVVVRVEAEHGVGDVAFQHGVTRCGDVLQALLEAVDRLVRDHDAHGTQLWIRHATPDDVLTAVATGYAVDRRLAVLGRSLPAPDGGRPSGVTVRPGVPADTDAVVAVLAAAYAGTPDAGWDRDRFAEHAARPWFAWGDLLVAVNDATGSVLGLHWTKRRDARTGEVYNLAVAPDGQGRGLGRLLLDAGLAHLSDAGCTEVLLWVDLANEAAVRLYTTAGFTTRWEDIAFVRHTRHVGRHEHRGSGTPTPER